MKKNPITNIIAFGIIFFILGTYAFAGMESGAYGILIIPAFGVFLLYKALGGGNETS